MGQRGLSMNFITSLCLTAFIGAAAHANTDPSQISREWKKCSSNSDCVAGNLSCYGWVPINKAHMQEFVKAGEGNSCRSNIHGLDVRPEVGCQKGECVATGKEDPVPVPSEFACQKVSDCAMIQYDCNQAIGVNTKYADQMREKVCDCHDCVTTECSQFNKLGPRLSCTRGECQVGYTNAGWYPLDGPDKRPDPDGAKWKAKFGTKVYPSCQGGVTIF